MNTDMIRIAVASLTFALAACDLAPVEDEDPQAGQGSTEGDEVDEDEGEDDGGDGDPSELDEEGAQALAEIAVDAGDGASSEAALIATVSIAASNAAEAGVSSDDALAEAAASATTIAGLCPGGGVATASRDASTVTYDFLGCTSHCGLVRATGRVTVDYELLEAGVAVDIETTGFKVNGSRTDLALSAQYMRSGSVDSMSIDTDATVTGWFGYQISRVGSYRATFDSSSLCITHDGEWTTTFGQTGYTTTLDGYRRCALQCPDAGSRLQLTTLDELYTFEAEFSSSTTLQWSTSNGWAGTLEIPACEQ